MENAEPQRFREGSVDSNKGSKDFTPEQLEKYASEIRSLIQHEDSVQNYRFTWFSAFQALLFAATGAAWDKTGVWPLIYLICIVGTVSALTSWHALLLSDKAYTSLEKSWKEIKDKGYTGPDRQGTEEGTNLQLMPSRIMPPTLALCWLTIGIGRAYFQFFLGYIPCGK